MNLRNRWPDYLLPVGIISCLMVIFVPLPPTVMDLLLAGNITVAVVILLSTVYIKTPLELNIFPSLLLATTLARLALNIGTTRLILTRGAIDGEMAAGGVIQSFSQFVTGNNLAVGLVIFSIIVIVQFVVITKGSTRISEVAARFALDGLPGRQMAIDAELNAGTIDNQQAKRLRQETIAHADFYGAMDGASKFVRGDAIAGVAITLINIAGGLVIGLASGMSLADATETFTKLTIGDGLVSQLPALLIAMAAGLLVTRRTQKTDLPRESMEQVFARPIVLVLTAIFLGLLVITDLPKIPLLLIAGGCLGTAYVLSSGREKANKKPESAPTQRQKPAATEVTLDKLLNNEVMEMELGVGLIRLADARQGGQLLALITAARKSIAEQFGVVLPKIRIRDNLHLQPEEFQIIVQGTVVKQGVIHCESCLAIDDGKATGPVDNGAVNAVPEEGLISSPGFWITPETSESSKSLGYRVLAADEVLADQLKQATLANPAQILTRDATRQLIDEVEKSSPAVVEELIPSQMSLGQIQQILKLLLDEGVSIRPLSLILETLGDNVRLVDSPFELVEKVRIRLARHIAASLIKQGNMELSAFTIAEDLQDRLGAAWERKVDEIRIGLPREFVQNLAIAIDSVAKKMAVSDLPPVILVDQSIRPVIAELVIHSDPRIHVLGSREIAHQKVRILGEINTEQVQSIANSAA